MKNYRTLFHELILTYRPFETQLNEQLSKHGLHRTQWSVLYYLVMTEFATSVEIARIMGVEKPNIARTMKSLIEMGYVDTIQGQDKREKRLVVTDKGMEIFNEIRTTVDAFEQQLLLDVGEEEQLAFIHTLQKIKRNLSTRSEENK